MAGGREDVRVKVRDEVRGSSPVMGKISGLFCSVSCFPE